MGSYFSVTTKLKFISAPITSGDNNENANTHSILVRIHSFCAAQWRRHCVQASNLHVTFANEIVYRRTSQKPDELTAEYTLTKCELVTTCIMHMMADTRDWDVACSTLLTSTIEKVDHRRPENGIDWFILFHRIRAHCVRIACPTKNRCSHSSEAHHLSVGRWRWPLNWYINIINRFAGPTHTGQRINLRCQLCEYRILTP